MGLLFGIIMGTMFNFQEKFHHCKNGYGVCFIATDLTNKRALELERELLIKCKEEKDINLVNITLGGEDGPKKMTKVAKEKFRQKKSTRIYCFQTGEQIKVNNLKKFCRENNYSIYTFTDILRGRKTGLSDKIDIKKDN